VTPRRLLFIAVALLAAALTGRRIYDRCVTPDYRTIDLAAMANFNFTPTNPKLEDIPAQYRALDGQRVQVTAEVCPFGYTLQPLTFTLGRGPFTNHFHPVKAQQLIVARARPGKASSIPGSVEVTVYGALHVSLKQNEDGEPVEVYAIDVDRIDPVEMNLLPSPPVWQMTALYAAVALAALSVALLARKAFESRRPLGICPTCGYDTRATPKRCPECGTPLVERWPR